MNYNDSTRWWTPSYVWTSSTIDISIYHKPQLTYSCKPTLPSMGHDLVGKNQRKNIWHSFTGHFEESERYVWGIWDMFAILPITHTNTSCNKEHWLQYGYHKINFPCRWTCAPTFNAKTDCHIEPVEPICGLTPKRGKRSPFVTIVSGKKKPKILANSPSFDAVSPYISSDHYKVVPQFVC